MLDCSIQTGGTHYMKYTHKNLELIESWIDKTNTTIILSDDFVREVYHVVLAPLYPNLSLSKSVKQRRRGFCLQYDFVRRDLLKILHRRSGGSAESIRCGYVYAITNPAWKNFIKIGSSVDVVDRLKSYQTSSPLRDYFLLDYYFVWDRLKEESYLHSLFPDRNNEWCVCDKEQLLAIFKTKKKERLILPLEHVLDTKVDTKVDTKCWYKILQACDDTQ
jgi:hypothetical protein